MWSACEKLGVTTASTVLVFHGNIVDRHAQ